MTCPDSRCHEKTSKSAREYRTQRQQASGVLDGLRNQSRKFSFEDDLQKIAIVCDKDSKTRRQMKSRSRSQILKIRPFAGNYHATRPQDARGVVIPKRAQIHNEEGVFEGCFCPKANATLPISHSKARALLTRLLGGHA